MGIGMFDIVSYPVWKLGLMLLGAMALSYLYGRFTAAENANDRSFK